MPGKRLAFEVTQLIYYNHQLGKSIPELVEIFSVSRKTVYNILNRAEKEGRLEPKSGGGCKTKINKRVDRLIMRKAIANPRISVRSLAQDIREECHLTVSHETVRQVILRHRYSSRVARKKPLLSEINIEKRHSFAVSMMDHAEEYWDDVIFCDETKMMLFYNDGPSRVWRKPLSALETQNIIPTIKFGKLSVMIWGCISSHGVGKLAFIESTMNAVQYLDILKTNLKASAEKFGLFSNNKPNFKFYQDNDPKHKEYNVRNWLLYNCGKVIDTPPQSPDLNPIENLWAYLKKKVAKRGPKTRQQLMAAIIEEWEKIPLEYDLKKLIHSMKKRLQLVAKANGGHTKY
nr:transposase - fruit fly (Drosophila melanogaster) transposon element S [Drosophila melanogaster]